MCNDYRLEVEIASIMEDFDDLKIKVETPEGTPNTSRADIKMTDIAPIIRSIKVRAVRASWSTDDGAGPVRTRSR